MAARRLRPREAAAAERGIATNEPTPETGFDVRKKGLRRTLPGRSTPIRRARVEAFRRLTRSDNLSRQFQTRARRIDRSAQSPGAALQVHDQVHDALRAANGSPSAPQHGAGTPRATLHAPRRLREQRVLVRRGAGDADLDTRGRELSARAFITPAGTDPPARRAHSSRLPIHSTMQSMSACSSGSAPPAGMMPPHSASPVTFWTMMLSSGLLGSMSGP